MYIQISLVLGGDDDIGIIRSGSIKIINAERCSLARTQVAEGRRFAGPNLIAFFVVDSYFNKLHLYRTVVSKLASKVVIRVFLSASGVKNF